MIHRMISQSSTSIYRTAFVLFLLLSVAGCTRTHTNDQTEYLAWLNDLEHGLHQVRTINGLRIAVKYLPPEYRAYQELQGGGTSAEREAAKRRCESSMAFLLSVSRDSSQPVTEAVDPRMVMQQGIMLDAMVKDHMTLRADGSAYTPVLTALDNNAGMSETINVMVLYVDDAGKGKLVGAEHYDVALDDALFGTGITHFIFSRTAIGSRLHLDF